MRTRLPTEDEKEGTQREREREIEKGKERGSALFLAQLLLIINRPVITSGSILYPPPSRCFDLL
jgi:hypothetical protein